MGWVRVTPGEVAYGAAFCAGVFAFYTVISKALGWAFPGRLPRVRLAMRSDELVVFTGVSAEPQGTLTLAYRIILTNQRLVMRRERLAGESLDFGLLRRWWDGRPRFREVELVSLQAVLMTERDALDLILSDGERVELRPQRWGFGSAGRTSEWAAEIVRLAPLATWTGPLGLLARG